MPGYNGDIILYPFALDSFPNLYRKKIKKQREKDYVRFSLLRFLLSHKLVLK